MTHGCDVRDTLVQHRLIQRREAGRSSSGMKATQNRTSPPIPCWDGGNMAGNRFTCLLLTEAWWARCRGGCRETHPTPPLRHPTNYPPPPFTCKRAYMSPCAAEPLGHLRPSPTVSGPPARPADSACLDRNMAPLRSHADGTDGGDGLESARKVRGPELESLLQVSADLTGGGALLFCLWRRLPAGSRWWRSNGGLESTRAWSSSGSSSLSRM